MQKSRESEKSITCRKCQNEKADDQDKEPEKRENVLSENIWTSSRALKNWVGGGLLALGIILTFGITNFNSIILSLHGTDYFISDFLFLVSIGIGGNVIIQNGIQALKAKTLNISLLMTSAILGSITVSILGGKHIFLEGATLAFLFNLAELLEDYSIEKAKGSLLELMDLSPDRATLKRDGEEMEISVEEVEVGDTVLIKPGSKIPIDGKITKGNSSINEAPITGESIPVDKEKGDKIHAGTINEQGYIEAVATRKSSESTISKIVDMVKNAERDKTKQEKFVEDFSTYYTLIIVFAAVAIAMIPPLAFGGGWTEWFLRGITMLVLACPCAFVISTPVTIVSGITNGAKNGVLIESGTSLEAMGDVKVMAFDKTGTLTKGELTVTDVIPFNGRSREDVIKCACGVEKRSEHPIAEAIINHVKGNQETEHDHEIKEFEEISGKGVKASLEGKKHYAGKPSLIEELGFDLKHVHHSSDSEKIKREATRMCKRDNCLNLLGETIPRLQEEGKTVILITSEAELEGIVAVADEIRPNAKEVIEDLKTAGIKPVMLTGDNENTARVIANEINIEDYQAELLPNEKVEALNRLSEEHGTVAMVGDGINDAPALATADVGISMGAVGTDTAIETADIALMKDDLSKLPYLQKLASRAKAIIRENIFSSLGIKAILAIGVPLGYVTIAIAVLAGDAGMTLGITGNAMRLSRLNPD